MILLEPRCKGNFDTLPQQAWELLHAAVRVGGTSLAALNIRPTATQSVPLAAARRVALATGDVYVSPLADGPVWDVVDGIESAGEEEVFDISVPGPHNFVANDMIVHNSTYARCGIICNVTPLEPEWEGHVTLEFSNTTPLPAKIYANEGVAQMLFFESDEICETSYADRGGKYQGQRGRDVAQGVSEALALNASRERLAMNARRRRVLIYLQRLDLHGPFDAIEPLLLDAQRDVAL